MPQVQPNDSSNGANGKSHHAIVENFKRPLPPAVAVQAPLTESERTAAFWIGTFHRYHMEDPRHVPLRLKMMSCPQRGDDGKAVLNRRGQPVSVRYLWEVAAQRIGRRPRWYFILWGIDDHSLRIKRCGSLREALTLYEQPVSMVLELKAPGVRLCKEFLPVRPS